MPSLGVAFQTDLQNVALSQGKLAVQATRDRLSGLTQEVKLYIESNPSSARALGFGGGSALAVLSFLGLFNIPEILIDPMEYLKNIYCLGFGLTIVILDGSENWLPSIRDHILKHMYFLNSLIGRGIFYMFVACLIATEASFFDKILGWYLAAITVWNLMLHFKRSRETPSEIHRDLQNNLPANALETGSYTAAGSFTAAGSPGPVVSSGYIPPPVHTLVQHPHQG